MRILFRRRFAAISLLAITLALLAVTRASALPAVWVVETPTSKVYLFGTVHVLKPGMSWHTAVIDAAIAESQDLWIEVADADDVGAMLPSLRQLGFDPAHPLSTKISQADVAALDQRAKELGLPGESRFEPMQPWLVLVALETIPALHAGYSPTSGADFNVKSIFTDAHKPVHGFETIDQQMRFLADVPEDQQVGNLHKFLTSIGSASTSTKVIDNIITTWYGGDVDRIASYADAYAKLDPTFADTILIQRNANWAKQIADILKQPGVSFIAVGALHLAGTQSVLADLEKLGYHARRIQ
jgi:uncharacterized protein YbaP (TraB family)